MKKLALLWPLIAAGLIIGFFTIALLSNRNIQTIPSALLNRPVPSFIAPPITGLDRAGVASQDFKGPADHVTLINVWASWCTPCIAEHPYITRLSRHDNIRLFGLNYKDTPNAANQFLQKHGNPYEKIGVDKDGTIAIEFGVYGVPETYLIDHKGIIRYKVVGPVTPDIIEQDLLPLIENLTKAAAP